MVYYIEYGVSVLNVLVLLEFRQNITVLKLCTGWVQKIFTSPKRPYPLCGPVSLLFDGYRIYFLGFARQGRDLDHSPPLRNQIKNEWT